MKAPLSWLSLYVPLDLPVGELAHRLTMAGTEVGEVEVTGDWERDKVVVGQVLKVERHPNADRLTLPTVDLGDGKTATVVCGAPNVAAGQKIAFAHEGARLFSARSGKVEALRPANIRGVVSLGMVCSEMELGLGEDHGGIIVLDDDAPVGVPLADYLGDAVLDIEVTPNRPDCLSMLGIAREAAALTSRKVTEPSDSYPEDGPAIEDLVTVEVADPDLCSRYTASLITGVEVGPSPKWLQDALIKADQRPVNNVVDVTNYVMLEYGQPLHAFDFDRVKDSRVVVRRARAGERLTTLDGEDRMLGPQMLTISDSSDAIGLAGVIGGAGSQMTGETTSVLLESATFDAINTRRTAAALRLSTGASYRFERGVRPELAPRALRRATKLILDLAGGQAARGIVDIYPGEGDSPTVTITRERIRKVLGIEMEMAEVARVLESLGFAQAGPADDRDAVTVTVPYWRMDIGIEDDLVEEVARIVGYDSIPTTAISTSIPHHSPRPVIDLKDRVRDLLAATGMRETISYSLTSLTEMGKVGALNEGPEPLAIANPMSGEQAYLRTTLRAGALSGLASNLRVSRSEGVRTFEIGRVFIPKPEAKERELPDERETLVGVMAGPSQPVSWGARQADIGFYDAKGVLELMFTRLRLNVLFEKGTDAVLHPGRTARMSCGGVALGVVGEVQPSVLQRFGIDGLSAALFEIDIESLQRSVEEAGSGYQAPNRYPESARDLALILPADLPSAAVQALLERHKLIVRSVPFDVYVGDEVPPGKKSVAYRVVFQSDRGTLTAAQVNNAQGAVLRQLRRELGVELRGAAPEKSS
jgi:phenylalanyl-tRNA synthetase beta chain